MLVDINTILCPIKVKSNTVELTVHPSCYCVLVTLRLRLTLCYEYCILHTLDLDETICRQNKDFSFIYICSP